MRIGPGNLGRATKVLSAQAGCGREFDSLTIQRPSPDPVLLT